jgi:hypothetical protein
MITADSYQPKDGRLVQFFAKDEPYLCGCYGGVYGVYSPNNAFLPFVFNLNLEAVQAFSISIYDVDSGKRLLCIPSSQVPHDLYKVANGTHRFVYNGLPIPGMQLANNRRYYIEMLGFRSCPFVAQVDLECLTKVSFGNATELFGLPYHRGFLQWVWLDLDIGNFTYDSFTVQQKDELGRLTVNQARLEKVWTFELFDLPENIYQPFVTASILDILLFQKGEKQITAGRKRATTTPEKNGIICERDLKIETPDAYNDQLDGGCGIEDNWEDVDNETGGNTCDVNVWIDTGRFRCIPETAISGCNPKPQIVVQQQCFNNAGVISISPFNVPIGQAVEFSIDNGSNYRNEGTFSDLPNGNYKCRMRYVGTLCVSDVTNIAILCGIDTEPVWESTGIAVCIEELDNSVDWEATGQSVCILEDNDAYDLEEIPEFPNDIPSELL